MTSLIMRLAAKHILVHFLYRDQENLDTRKETRNASIWNGTGKALTSEISDALREWIKAVHHHVKDMLCPNDRA